MSGEAGCRLYLITPPRLEPDAFAPILAAALDAGDVACVQLRLKHADDDAIRRAAERLAPIVQGRDVALVMNDRPDLAVETGCDGVHVGQQDMSVKDARRLIGADGIVGATGHDSRHLAIVAAEDGADYVAFGAFFPTPTKEARGHPSPEILRWWRGFMTVPCVAIGGITVENCATPVAAGADFIAVVAGVWNHPDGAAAAVKAYNRAIAVAG